MPINPIQRTHTQMHASFRLHVLLMLLLMPLLLGTIPGYCLLHRYRYHTHTIIAALALHQLPTCFTHTNRPASAHAYKLTCLHALLSLSHSRSRSLCMCCPFPSLSHPPSAAIRRRSSAPSVLSCSPASHPPHLKLASVACLTPKMRALQDARRLRHRQRCERRRCC